MRSQNRAGPVKSPRPILYVPDISCLSQLRDKTHSVSPRRIVWSYETAQTAGRPSSQLKSVVASAPSPLQQAGLELES